MTTTTYYAERVAIALGIIVGAFLILMTARPAYLAVTTGAPCGYVVEEAEVIPAGCTDLAELEARLDALHLERSGRFADQDAAADLGRCAETNGAPLTLDACRGYLAETAAVAAACPMPDQDAWERCAAEVTR